MHYFVEITCLEDEGISTGFVMSRVMELLHLCLVNLEKQLGMNPVGIAFPEYRYGKKGETPRIGTKIRLFSLDPNHLESLEIHQQLQRLSDYVHIRSVSKIDRPNLAFACFKRVQPKPSCERLIRRQIKRSGQPENIIRQRYQAAKDQRTNLPYVNMKSHSSEQRFPLFVQKCPGEGGSKWQFNTYGLSGEVSVPDF